jgi:hypothetical protein
MTNYKVGQQVYVKEWTTWYLGTITDVLNGLLIIEANGHKHWLRADYVSEQQKQLDKMVVKQ